MLPSVVRYTKLNGKKQRIAAGSDERVILKREVSLPETDYQSTYQRHRQYRPRSTKKPPTAPADPNPPPMVFDTNQRREFTPKDLGARATLVKIVRKYILLDVYLNSPPTGSIDT